MQSVLKEQSHVRASAAKAKALSVVAVAAVLLATLWPLNPRPRNGVTWLHGTNGLRFEKAGLVVSRGTLRVPENAASQACALELLLRPAGIKSANTILAFFDPKSSREFQLRQWSDSLILTHDSRIDSDRTGKVKIDIDHLFRGGTLAFVVVSSGPDGTTVYLDGEKAGSFPRFKISRSDLSGELVLGTAPDGYEPWSGEIRGLTIYGEELTAQVALQHYHSWVNRASHPPSGLDIAIGRYTFAEGAGSEVHSEVASAPTLRIPPAFSLPHKAFLESPAEEFSLRSTYVHNLVTNIAGFVPLGLIVCSYIVWTRRRWTAVLMTIAFCASLSFAIEVMQYYIPKRDSGMTDIITNTLGAALGAFLLESNLVRTSLERIGILPTTLNA